VRAHQDDSTLFENLSRKAQLNCICDHTAKQWIAIDGSGHRQSGRLFPLEPIGMFIQGEKLTSDTGDLLSFWAHRQLAREYYGSSNMILHAQLDRLVVTQKDTLGTATVISTLGCKTYEQDSRHDVVPIAPGWPKQPLPKLRGSLGNLSTHHMVSRGRTGGGLRPVHKRSGDMAEQQ
jgi:hypothetical protein